MALIRLLQAQSRVCGAPHVTFLLGDRNARQRPSHILHCNRWVLASIHRLADQSRSLKFSECDQLQRQTAADMGGTGQSCESWPNEIVLELGFARLITHLSSIFCSTCVL